MRGFTSMRKGGAGGGLPSTTADRQHKPNLRRALSQERGEQVGMLTRSTHDFHQGCAPIHSTINNDDDTEANNNGDDPPSLPSLLRGDPSQ